MEARDYMFLLFIAFLVLTSYLKKSDIYKKYKKKIDWVFIVGWVVWGLLIYYSYRTINGSN